MKKTIKIKNLISEKNAQTVWIIHHDINYGDFDFTEVSLEDVKKEILNLNVKNSSTNGSISARVLKQSAEIHLPFLTKSINHMVTKSDVPRELKNSEVIIVLKKRRHSKEGEHRPVSFLLYVPMVFERLICKQITIWNANNLNT